MASRLLQETGFALLQENGFYILLNEEPSASGFASTIEVTRTMRHRIGVTRNSAHQSAITRNVTSRVVIA